ncbi:MAG: nicotinate-nucleotide--dimethylbenzimidazole phosphoribosyltransferase [Ornithinimicrobium sp.]
MHPETSEISRHIARALEAKTKPPRSLGRIEDIAVELGVAQGTEHPCVDPAGILVFAGDHGVATDGVSAYPCEVTAQMCANFVDGGAAVSVLATSVKARLTVVDVGVAADVSGVGGLVHAKVAHGTANMRYGPAMSPEQTQRACDVGRQAAEQAVEEGARCLALGEMGIGNTTSAAVLTALLCGRPAEEVTGRGTGVASSALTAKRRVVADVVERVGPMDAGPQECLRQAGGLEVAALVGAMLAAPPLRVPVLVDGFIVTAAALVACGVDPEVRNQLIFAHRSTEPGHVVALQALQAEPLLNLGLALGEGSGSALALPLLRAACDILSGMATFAGAGISEAST